MTVSYTSEVPNGSSFGVFWKILFKWRGSVYKLVWRELIAFLGAYYVINCLYRYGLQEEHQSTFEFLRNKAAEESGIIPLSFVLGFYVNLIVKRWWDQYKLLPWPDTLALFISAAIPGNNETGRLMRRNIMRYAVLAYVVTLMRISLRVKRRFPSLQHLVDAGLMLESEKKIFEKMDGKSPMSKYWMPLVWATNIINRARKQEIISSDHIVQTLLVELSDIRRRLGALIGFDTVCVPLVYTQVVTWALYSYFFAALLARQIIPKEEEPDLLFPFFGVLQFCFYVGWLKVAEVLINPFGEDDDDIELNWLIDRHIKASYMIVDEMHEEHPELLKDQYWDQVVPVDLPYTVASEHYRKYEPKGSAENYKVKEADAMYANIILNKRTMPDDVYADYESVDTPMVERRKNNWFSRQITKMGSIRSSSAYSSGGLFKRNRHNSVYLTPGKELESQGVQSQPQKMSLYEKFVNRKSLQNQRQLSKQISTQQQQQPTTKGRPRIPTPNTTGKSGSSIGKENRFTLMPLTATPTTPPPPPLPPILPTEQIGITGNVSNIAAGVALATRKLATEPSVYPNIDIKPPFGTLILSPIKESDTGSANNTLQPNSQSTIELAKTVFSPSQIPSFSSVAGTGTVSTNSPSLIGEIKTISSVPTISTIAPSPIDGSLGTTTITVATTNLPISEEPFNLNDDEFHFKKLSRQNSIASATELLSVIRNNGSDIIISPSRSEDVIRSISAPSTLLKAKPESNTDEVYV